MASQTPKVSIIVPVYNTDIYLRKCLDSLVTQTLEGLEIILVDDDSADFSTDIAQAYVRHFPALFQYCSIKHGGVAAARNQGLALSRGAYIAFVDSDDFVAPGIFETMYAAAVRDDADLVCCGYDCVSAPKYDPDRLKTVNQVRFHAMQYSGQSATQCPPLMVEVSGFVWGKLYRRSLLEAFSFPDMPLYEDFSVVYGILEKANRVTLVNSAGYYYRTGRTGALRTGRLKRKELFGAADKLLQCFSEGEKDAVYRNELAYLCYRHLIETPSSRLKNASVSFVRKYIRDSFAFMNAHFPGWEANRYLILSQPVTAPKYEQANFRLKSSRAYLVSTLFEKGKRKLGKLSDKSKRVLSRLRGKPRVHKKASAAPLSPEILQDIQAGQRGILRVIHSFCAEHGLRYYAAEGSLLGAVRHEGFIPWDDDMDLAMPREDYEKLIALWGNKVYSDCVLLSRETYPDYYLPFIKIVQNRNIRYKTPSRKTPEYFQGLSIDIFPLDAAPAYGTPEEKRRLRSIRLTRDMMLYKVGNLSVRARRLNCILHGAPLRSMSSLQDRITALCTAYRGQDVPCLSNYCSSYPPVREVFPREWWSEPHEGRFDDTVIMLPAHSDLILSTIYGAYREFPPEEQQVCKHKYQRVEKSGSAGSETKKR